MRETGEKRPWWQAASSTASQSARRSIIIRARPRPPEAAARAACASPSPTAATCAASTACRRRSTSGCRGDDILHVRRDRAARPASSRRSASTACGSPAASRCCAAICRRSCGCSPRAARIDGSGAHDQRRAARAITAQAPPRRRTAPHHRQPRHPARRSLPGAHALRRAAARARRHRRRTHATSSGVKIDSVIVRGVNDDEIVPLLDYARHVGAEVRFIEYMDVGGATRWSPDRVVSRAEMLERIEPLTAPSAPSSTAAGRRPIASRLATATTFGIISSTTAPFCRTCDRSRLTADGLWFRCLYAARRNGLAGTRSDPVRRTTRSARDCGNVASPRGSRGGIAGG